MSPTPANARQKQDPYRDPQLKLRFSPSFDIVFVQALASTAPLLTFIYIHSLSHSLFAIMHSFSVVASLLSVAALAKAQSFAYGGQGRFPCSKIVNGVTTIIASACDNDEIAKTQSPACVASDSAFYGDVDGGGFKNYGYIPQNSQCIQDSEMPTNYYCGFIGATCDPTKTGADTGCDNGSCSSAGVCVGGLGSPCSVDSECLGNIYCLNPNGESTGAGLCGYSDSTDGSGSVCDDGCAGGNFLCNSAACDGKTGTCFPSLAGASQRARSRRDTITARESRCPASHSTCAVAGSSRGFECIDTTSNLEQCGACAADGGVDCTALPGVDAVGCVAGQCEIWACAESYEWDASSASCALSVAI